MGGLDHAPADTSRPPSPLTRANPRHTLI